MTTGRKLMLAVAVLAVAALASSQLLGAAQFGSQLTALERSAIIGQTTPLMVDVDPMYVGGTGVLFATLEGAAQAPLGTFAVTGDHFVLAAPVPQGTVGDTATYFIRAIGPDGTPTWSNGAPVLLRGGQGTDEPPIWD